MREGEKTGWLQTFFCLPCLISHLDLSALYQAAKQQLLISMLRLGIGVVVGALFLKNKKMKNYSLSFLLSC